MTRSNKFWAVVILFLIIVIAVGSIFIWSKYNRSQPIEITIPPSLEISGQITVTGAVNVPGIYSLTSGDSFDALLQSAGGATASADLGRIKLYIPSIDEAEISQKVDLNRAETWLLQALPGIGETRAQAIANYRQQNGQFSHISEITSVEGIGTATYEKIKHRITVSD